MRSAMIVLVIALVLLGGLYGWMRLGSSRALEAQKGDFQTQLDDAHDALRQAREEVNAERTKSTLLEVTNALYHTAADLEARNFGTAEERMRTASQMLDGVEQTAAVDSEALVAIRESLEGFSMDVTADVGQQRAAILELAKRLEQLTSKRTE